MPRSIDRDELRALLDAGAQLVDVLPAEDFAASHIEGAVNIPLPSLAERARELDRARTVVAYCYDFQ